MHLTNGEFTLLGPGSEWFWSAVSGVVVAVTLIALWRQLQIMTAQKSRDDQAAIDAEWDAERMLRYRLEIARAVRDHVEPRSFPMASTIAVANFWEELGGLARHGHMDIKMLSRSSGVYAYESWKRLAPWVRYMREERNQSNAGTDFEWLAMEVRRISGQHWEDLAAQRPADQLDLDVQVLEDLIAIEVELRRSS